MFQRKQILLISIVLIVLLGIHGCQQGAESPISPGKRPNLLFIMSDDHAYQAISAYSDKLIQTPNIDRIAKEGILFTNASVTNSICAPSRATMLTGKHTHIHGKIDNRSPFDTTQVTFPQILQKNGYRTAMFGKLHFGNNPKGVDDFMILPGQGHYLNPSFVSPKGDTLIEGHVTKIITDLTLNWLQKEAKKEGPFALMYFHKAPHRSWWPTPEKMKANLDKNYPLPTTLFDDYATRGSAAKTAEMRLYDHMMYRYDTKVAPEAIDAMKAQPMPAVPDLASPFAVYRERATKAQQALYDPIIDHITEDFTSRWPSMNTQEKTIWKYQRYMQDYLACIADVDEEVGRVLDYLDTEGLSDNTIVVYTSDQGFYLGEHGWFDKRFMYNESFKTPVLIRWPHVIQPGTTSDEMVQNLDFAQSFLEACGIQAPTDMQGESMLPIWQGTPEKWQRDAAYYHYYEYPAEHQVKRHYGIATKQFKLIHFYYDVDEWELYDLINDPNEQNNLIKHPEYQLVVTGLKEKLSNLRKKYKDSPELDQQFIERYTTK